VAYKAEMMTVKISPLEFNLFKHYLSEQCGIVIENEKVYLLESRLAEILQGEGLKSFSELYSQVVAGKNIALRSRIIDAMTTNETFWFRDRHPFDIFQKVILPHYAKDLNQRRFRIRIWSAACSTGQEPYSLSMVIHDYCKSQGGRITPQNFEIVATDLSYHALEIAKTGCYLEMETKRGLSAERIDHHFDQCERKWCIKPDIRSIVTFQHINLKEDFKALGRFDIIFLRNVMIYFSDDFKKNLISGMAAALAPEGFFIIGATENIQDLSKDFTLHQGEEGIYYRRNY
jgi:chemotaxis protein methyltransferase CheR